jgi:ribose 5-phosphate isomerase
MTVDALEVLAAHALEFVTANTTVGLGAGRAAAAFVRALGERVRAGLQLRGVPASEETAALAREVGIPLAGLESELELTVDGADEVDPKIEPITDASALERSIRSIPGVVDTGLFLEMADTALVADGSTVRELTRQKAR